MPALLSSTINVVNIVFELSWFLQKTTELSDINALDNLSVKLCIALKLFCKDHFNTSSFAFAAHGDQSIETISCSVNVSCLPFLGQHCGLIIHYSLFVNRETAMLSTFPLLF